MAVSVVSHSFFDNQRSKMRLGVTDKGTPYMDLAPIFEEYIGVEFPERGARVYDQDSAIFLPLSAELISYLKIMVDKVYEDVGTENINADNPLYVTTPNGRRQILMFNDQGSVVVSMILMDNNGNELNYIEHHLGETSIDNNVISNDETYNLGLEIIKEFLDKVMITQFKLVYQGAHVGYNNDNSGGNNYNSNSGGGGAPTRRRRAGGPNLRRPNQQPGGGQGSSLKDAGIAPRRRISAEDISALE